MIKNEKLNHPNRSHTNKYTVLKVIDICKLWSGDELIWERIEIVIVCAGCSERERKWERNTLGMLQQKRVNSCKMDVKQDIREYMPFRCTGLANRIAEQMYVCLCKQRYNSV